jgi:outer membrane protein
MSRALSTALFALFAAARLGAQEAPEPVRISLEDALARARAASARLGELKAWEDAAGAGLRGAKAQRLPSLALGAGYSRNSNVPEFVATFPGEGPRVIFPNLPNQGFARASVSLPLYTGGRVEGAISASQQQLAAAQLDASAGEADLALETTTAYWSLVAEREAERVLRQAITSYAAHLEDAANRYDVGLAARNDVLAVQVEKDRAELARLDAENAASLAQANLVRLLDLPAQTTIEPTSEGVAAPIVEAPIEALVSQALGSRAEIAALRARVAAADAGAQVARSAALPQASLQGSYDYSHPNTRIFPLEGVWRDTWSVGVSVSFTAFDGGRTKAATTQARAQAEARRQQLADLERRLRLEVTARALELRTARAALEVTERNLEAAGENVRVNQDRYKAGVSLSSDLLDAERQCLQAGLDKTRSATRLLVARASLDRAVGR